MHYFIQNLSGRAEYAIVLLSAFGYFILSSILLLLHPTSIPPISQHDLEHLLIYESVILVLLCTFLHLRGWTTERLSMSATLQDILIVISIPAGSFLRLYSHSITSIV
jgi:hypothetical protein